MYLIHEICVYEVLGREFIVLYHSYDPSHFNITHMNYSIILLIPFYHPIHSSSCIKLMQQEPLMVTTNQTKPTRIQLHCILTLFSLNPNNESGQMQAKTVTAETKPTQVPLQQNLNFERSITQVCS